MPFMAMMAKTTTLACRLAPHDMYCVCTVEDAIFANVPVTGVSYDVDLNSDLIKQGEIDLDC